MMRYWIGLTVGVLSLIGLVGPARGESPQEKRANGVVVKSTPLGKQRGDFVLRQSCLSPGGGHLVNITSREEKRRIWIDGQEGQMYDEIDPLGIVQSPDGQRTAWIARRRRLWFVVVDGKESRGVDGILRPSLVFSPDSKRFAYIAQDNERLIAFADGQELGEFNGTVAEGAGVRFSPDSRRLAVAMAREGKFFVWIDGQEGPKLDGLYNNFVQFSGDSQHYGSIGTRNKKHVVIVDGKEIGAYEAVGELGVQMAPRGERWFFTFVKEGKRVARSDRGEEVTAQRVGPGFFSADGSSLGYGIVRAGREQVVINGEFSKQYDPSEAGEAARVVFSADGKHHAYAARRDSKSFVVIDWMEGPGHEGIVPGSVMMSPDSKRVAYIALTGPTRSAVVVDGKAGKPYEGIALASLCFSPDSKHVHYVALREKKAYFVTDETEAGPYADLLSGARFSPDGKRVAYGAVRGGSNGNANPGALRPATPEKLMVVDGVEGVAGETFDEVLPGSLAWSADSKHVAYIAMRGSTAYAVMDGRVSPALDLVVTQDAPRFDDKGALHLITGKQGGDGLVEFFRTQVWRE